MEDENEKFVEFELCMATIKSTKNVLNGITSSLTHIEDVIYEEKYDNATKKRLVTQMVGYLFNYMDALHISRDEFIFRHVRDISAKLDTAGYNDRTKTKK